jgi:hypothetical protein
LGDPDNDGGKLVDAETPLVNVVVALGVAAAVRVCVLEGDAPVDNEAVIDAVAAGDALTLAFTDGDAREELPGAVTLAGAEAFTLGDGDNKRVALADIDTDADTDALPDADAEADAGADAGGATGAAGGAGGAGAASPMAISTSAKIRVTSPTSARAISTL